MSGFFDSQILERIKASNEIVEVIGGSLPLKRAGANFVALCPFHKEKSPSFNVNPHRQSFHCFGCGKGGDVFTFVQEYESISFIEAVRRLAERAHIPLETTVDPGQQQARFLKETLLKLHEQITQRWHTVLLNDAAGQVARDYLANRGVSAESIALFRLGFAPESWDDTVNWSKSKGYEPALVEQAGLIVHKQESNRYYDRFRGRLMFPICDEQGRVIGFSGRILVKDEKSAKYVNSPETPLFNKSRVIFGLDKTKRALLDKHSAVICEGQLDLIACYMAGVQNVVAPQGTAFTPDHARLLKRYVEEVVLCFDADNAGQNAAVRALDSLLAVGMAVRVATIPAPHDPDSFIKEKGPEAFQELINKADGFFDYYLKRLSQQHDLSQDKGRLAVLAAMGVAVQKTNNTVLIDKYTQKTAHQLGVSAESVRLEFRKIARRQAPPQAEAEPPESLLPEAETELPPPSPTEFFVLSVLLQHEELVEWIGVFLNPEWLDHPQVRHVVGYRLESQASCTWPGLSTWLAVMESSPIRSLVTQAMAEHRPLEVVEAILKGSSTKKGALQLLRDRSLDRQIAQLGRRLVQPDTPEEERIELMQRQHQLRQQKSQPLTPVNPPPEEQAEPW